MAKLAFSKLGLKVTDLVNPLMFGENTIEVKVYLPLEDKIKLVQTILNNTVDDNGYYNPIQLEANKVVEVTAAYTNLTFTEKQRESIYKLYDQLVSSGFWATLSASIPKSEMSYIEGKLTTLIDNIYAYRNSAAGILENLNVDYDRLNTDAKEIEASLQNKENLSLVRDVLTKMG